MSTGPKAPAVIERSRLSGVIGDTQPGSLCLLQAPRGYGATTALRHAMSAMGARPRWVDASGLTGAGSLTAAVGDWVDVDWLVIDGVRRPELVAADLADLAGRIPDATRVAVAGSVALGSLLLDQPWSTLLDRTALAFTEDEAMAMLAEMARTTDPGELALVAHLCQGWATALVVAAGRLRQGEPAVAAWLRAAGADGLVGRWFDDQPESIQRFLLDTAILGDLGAGECDAVRETTDSSAALATFDAVEGPVARVVETGAGPATWRRHRLLTEYLRARATSSAFQLPAHRRAAQWYVEHGLVREAMHHLLESGQQQAAGSLLREHEGDLISSGAAATTLDWYSRMSATTWGATAGHELRLGWGRLLVGDLSGARDSLARVSGVVLVGADSQLGQTPESLTLAGEVALLRAQVAAARGDTAEMIEAAEQATEILAADTSENSGQLAPIAFARGLLWEGQVERARAVVDRIDPSLYPNATLREVALRGVQAACAVAEGRIWQAAAILGAAEAWLGEGRQAALDLRQYTFLATQARTLTESGEVAAGQELAAIVVAAALDNAAMGDLTFARLALGRALVLGGDFAGALAVIRQARHELRLACADSAMVVPLGLAEADALQRAGDPGNAERLLRALPISEQRTLLAARILGVQQPARVARVMVKLRPSTPAAAMYRRLQLAECYLGVDAGLSTSHLTAAARLARQHGMAMALVDHPRLIELAVRLAVREVDEPLRWLTTAANVTRSAQAGARSSAVTPVDLSPGEVELLRWLPGRETKADIAAQMGISVNTVKTRLQRLYRKLGVRGRDEAIAEAKRRGLLPP